MRFRLAAALAVIGLTATACGTSASSGPSSHASGTVSPSAGPAACKKPAGKAWVRIKDPSGVSFMFPVATKADQTKSDGAITRTYVVAACGNTAVSVTIVPTPKQLDTRNFFAKYPGKLASQGAKDVKAGTITPLKLQSFSGFQSNFRYTQMPGPAPTYELTGALQLKKFFVIFDTVAVASKKLSAQDLADAKAVNAALLQGFNAAR
jgi:hypothetical protein